MIGGILMVLVVIWVYQSANKAKVSNPLMWVGIAAGVFFAVQMLLVQSNVFILEALRGGEADANYERDLLSIGDRKNQGGFQGVNEFELGQRRGLAQNNLRLRQRGGAQQVAANIFRVDFQHLLERRRRKIDAAGRHDLVRVGNRARRRGGDNDCPRL